jgi:hypothetical protein
MNHPQLDYAVPERAPSVWAHPWVAALLAFPLCWLLALLLYRSTTFPVGFEDEVFHWDEALMIMSVFGSSAGVIAYVVAAPILLLRRRARAAEAG